jgi:hypothetical protein
VTWPRSRITVSAATRFPFSIARLEDRPRVPLRCQRPSRWGRTARLSLSGDQRRRTLVISGPNAPCAPSEPVSQVVFARVSRYAPQASASSLRQAISTGERRSV